LMFLLMKPKESLLSTSKSLESLALFKTKIVAESGIEPESQGYAYHYSFRYCQKYFWVCGLDYTISFPVKG